MKFNILIALCHPTLLVPGVINKALLKLRFDHSFTNEIDISLAQGIASFKAFEEALSKSNTLGYRRDRSEYGLKMARICKRFRCLEFINIVILSLIPLSKKAVLDFIKRRLEE